MLSYEEVMDLYSLHPSTSFEEYCEHSNHKYDMRSPLHSTVFVTKMW